MQWLPLLTFVFLLLTCYAKETEIYEVTGGDLFDLIRGKHKGPLKLNKVEGDRTNLPDGVYFKPEDVALSNEQPKELYINGKNRNPEKK
uniref:Uncharacterized protein n=1 Tax=Lonomia obliqua TaxID=304329 RepID=Q5MGD6_LONON|nr:hypothetical protein 35 [Lonomia obliqua]